MQGKEPSDQETQYCTVGIDVSQSWLDVYIHPSETRLRVANDRSGIAKLKRRLLPMAADFVAVEATGRWHLQLCRSLSASGIAIRVVDPYRVRMFARASGIVAKTDLLDAKVLALYAALMQPSARELSPEVLEKLKELVTARASAVDERTAVENQLHAATDRFLKSQLTRRIDQLDSHVTALEKECLKRIKADATLARRYEILISVPGIGMLNAINLIVRLPELGSLTDKQIAALAGLAPVADDSGQRRGTRVIWGGRGPVRWMLYMAAMNASQHNPDLKAYYQRLKATGKEAKHAYIAVARKLIVLANLLLAQDRLWQPVAPKIA